MQPRAPLPSVPTHGGGARRTGDHYEWNKVTTCIHNVLSGPRWIEHYGEVLIRNTRDASYHCKLTFCKVCPALPRPSVPRLRPHTAPDPSPMHYRGLAPPPQVWPRAIITALAIKHCVVAPPLFWPHPSPIAPPFPQCPAP